MTRRKEIIVHIIDAFVIMIGIFGFLNSFFTSLIFPSSYRLMTIAFMIGGCLLYIYSIKKPLKIRYLLIVEMIIIFLSFLLFYSGMSSVLGKVIIIAINDFFLSYENILDASSIEGVILSLWICVPITYLVVSTYSTSKRIVLKLFVLILIFIFPLLIKHEVPSLSIYCVTFYCFYCFLFSYSLKHQSFVRLRALMIVLLISLLTFSNIFIEKNELFSDTSKSIFAQIVELFDGSKLERLSKEKYFVGTSSYIDGNLPTNNLKLTNRDAIVVRSSTPFSSYLRGYSLANYKDNEWTPVRGSYDEHEGTLRLLSQYIQEYTDVKRIKNVRVENKSKADYKFVPYSMAQISEFPLIDDSYYTQTESSLTIYPIEGIDFTKGTHIMGSYNYDEFVSNRYMEVSAHLKNKLNIFLLDQAKEMNVDIYNLNFSEAFSFVSSVLSKNTNYSLNSGRLPSNKDFVDYFLFENRLGSCTHYATTATLMMRILGFPSRYVTGYVIKQSDFVDGVATIKSNRAHAWVEVYEKTVGWVPLDATPSSTNGGSTPNQMAGMLDDLIQNQNQPTPNNPTPEQPQVPENTEDFKTDELPWYESLLEYSVHILFVFIIICCLTLYRMISKSYLKILLFKKTNNQKVLLYYKRLLRLLSFNNEDIHEEILHLTYKAKYSQYEISNDEFIMIEDYYQEKQRSVYSSLPLHRKILFKYILGYK